MHGEWSKEEGSRCEVHGGEKKESTLQLFPSGEPAVTQAILMAGVPVGRANPGGVMAKEERGHCL